MQPLTADEKQFLALALQGLCLRHDPELFATATRIALKLGVQEELQSYLRDWIAYAKKAKQDAH